MFRKTVKTLAKSNTQTSPLFLQKCKDLKHFKEIHAHLLKSYLPESPLLVSHLFSLAVSSTNTDLFAHVRSIFRHLSHRNTFIYNNMIRGYVQTNSPIPAILCYLDMLNYGLIANNYTFPPLIKACTLILHSSKLTGCLVHAHVIKFGFCDDPFALSALIEFYSSILDTVTARRLFDGVAKRDVVLWTTMIDGYGKVGDVENARALFDEMPERNVISWSAMMAGYSRVSDFREVLCFFRQMQEACVKPNESVLVSVLTACSHLGALAQGQWVHSYAKQYSLDSNVILATAIVDMYAKCGCIEAALSVFEGITKKDAGAWNAIISGVAMNSDARKSIELFKRMSVLRAQPNETTFVAILTTCTHSGLVEEGLSLFNLMETVYNVKPRLEHYACVVDLLARSGMLEEAEKFIEEHIGGFDGGDANVWGALLGACRVYGNVEVGNRVWKKLANLGIVDYGIYMTLYNMYKEAGWEIEAKRVRRVLNDLGLKKKPGCSLIEVDSAVDEFIAGDLSHPKAREMFSCSCPADHDVFVWHMDYMVQPGDSWELVSLKFGSFVMEMPEKRLIPSQTVTLDLLCGCSANMHIATYRIEVGDTLYTIASRFGADMNQMANLNKLDMLEIIHAGDIIFIPVSGPGSLILPSNRDSKARKVSNPRIHIIVGCVVAAAAGLLLLFIILFWIFYNKRKREDHLKVASGGSKCLRCLSALFLPKKVPKQNVVPFFNSDKSTVFSYNEVRDATFNFNMSKKIGEGSYGSVYLGRLRGAEVAIKQMKNTKSKEFMAELNILCKVHHTNLIELIGYAAGGNSLFLVYEFAQNGALSDHLRCLTMKGYKPISWSRRVQIALDAAKGLEYIHTHTKPYYVHRDVKTSNILLDSNFRAKIADFGLVKLLEHSPDVGTATSKIVGTFGYLAPEYVRDGCVTTKSDVYSFGVVLMELLTGQPALSRDTSSENSQYVEHRSVVDVILSALDDEYEPLTKLTQCVDPNLTLYHKDSLFKMALLSKDCVDEDWKRRPDMSRVVFHLSHILSCTLQWEGMEPICIFC